MAGPPAAPPGAAMNEAGGMNQAVRVMAAKLGRAAAWVAAKAKG